MCTCVGHDCSNKASFVIKVSNGDTGNSEPRGRHQNLCQSDIVLERIYSASASLLSLAVPLSLSLSFLCQFSPSLVPRDLCGNNRCTINVGQAWESERLMFLLSGLLAEGRRAMFGCAWASLCVFLLAPRLLKSRP